MARAKFQNVLAAFTVLIVVVSYFSQTILTSETQIIGTSELLDIDAPSNFFDPSKPIDSIDTIHQNNNVDHQSSIIGGGSTDSMPIGQTTPVNTVNYSEPGHTLQAATTKTTTQRREQSKQKDDDTVLAKEPLNVIILYPDDWRHDDIGGVAPVLKTPFLTKLAKDGIRFTYNAVTTSICWISRACLFTGQWVGRHGSSYLYRPHFAANPEQWAKTWPSLLQKNGYYVGHVGKWQYRYKDNYQHRIFNYSRLYHGEFWYMVGKGNNRQKVHVCDKTAWDAIDFLKNRPKDKPFALTVAHAPPKGAVDKEHTTEEFYNMYKHAFFPEPYNMSHAYSLLPKFLQNEKTEARTRWDYRWKGFGKIQESMRTYFATMTQIDRANEQIIDYIKQEGLYNNTMIIFTADNGEFRASHGLSDKWYPYQESIRVPLIIYDPRMPKKKRGTLDDSLTLNVDLAETVLGAAGVEPDESMMGRDISDLYLPCKDDDEKCKEPWREEFFYDFPIGSPKIESSTALVRKDWKYIMWPKRKYEQLFNLIDDPLEMNDLRSVPDFKDKMDEMRKRHDELRPLYGTPDQWFQM